MKPPPLTIFIVEDHPTLLNPLCRYLQLLGHRVESAGDLATALVQIPALNVDLLICDIGLPDGDGRELLRLLGASSRYLAITMTGNSAPDDQARSTAAGYEQHLVKPFLPEDLDPILEEAQRRAARHAAGAR